VTHKIKHLPWSDPNPITKKGDDVMRKTTWLKKLILDPEILVMPGAHDALSARIIEQIGFKAVSLGGAGYSICSRSESQMWDWLLSPR
jgi:hypothetical protein